MEDADIEQRFHLMQKEIEATVSILKEAKQDLMTAADSLKLEIEIIKMFLEEYHPGFTDAYPKLREEVMQSVDPEWMAMGSTQKS